MGSFLSWLLSLSIVIAPMQVFAPITYAAIQAELKSRSDIINSIEYNQVDVISHNTDDGNPYGLANFSSIELPGYCKIDMPMSHFILASSTSTTRNIKYKDGITELTIGYVVGLNSSIDVASFIANSILSLDTTTNNITSESHGAITYNKLVADKKNGLNTIYIWYVLAPDGNSAFWVKAEVAPETENEEFYYALDKSLETYVLYETSATVFETPETGIFANEEITSEEDVPLLNTEDNPVFQTRGGFVDADISDNWEDLEIIIDNIKFKLPTTLNTFYNAGYELNDRKKSIEDMEIFPDSLLDIELINDIGTVITVSAYNDSNNAKNLASDCAIVKIKVDPSKFITKLAKDPEPTPELTPEPTPEPEVEEPEVEEPEPEEPEQEEPEPEPTSEPLSHDEELQNIANEISDNINNRVNTSDYIVRNRIEGETAFQRRQREIATLNQYIEAEQTNSVSPELQAAVDAIPQDRVKSYASANLLANTSEDSTLNEAIKSQEHLVILPGGALLTAYVDDLCSVYGSYDKQIELSSSELELRWETINKYMILHTGAIKDINYIEMSAVSSDKR